MARLLPCALAPGWQHFVAGKYRHEIDGMTLGLHTEHIDRPTLSLIAAAIRLSELDPAGIGSVMVPPDDGSGLFIDILRRQSGGGPVNDFLGVGVPFRDAIRERDAYPWRTDPQRLVPPAVRAYLGLPQDRTEDSD